MGYKDKTIRVDFADLGKGCYAIIKNPALQPLEAPATLPEDPAERDAAFLGLAKSRVGKLITEWKMWDFETDAPLALPSVEPAVLDRCPGLVLNLLGAEINKRVNPTRPQETPTTKS